MQTQPTRAVNMQLSAPTQEAIQRLYGNVQQSMKAIEWLHAEGFEPFSIHVGRSVKPLIRIEGCYLCRKLKHACGAYPYMMRPGPSGRETVWRVDIFGCLVEWTEGAKVRPQTIKEGVL